MKIPIVIMQKHETNYVAGKKYRTLRKTDTVLHKQKADEYVKHVKLVHYVTKRLFCKYSKKKN